MQIEKSIQDPYGRIYRLTNKINGKMYHGQTTEDDIINRWNKYKHLQCKGQKKLYPALKKYGPENFLFEVVDTTPQDQTQLDNMEIFYIAKFDSMNNGYNCDPGGKGGKHSEETKRKISNSQKGRIFSPEHIKKLSISHKGQIGYFSGKHLSEEHKRRLSKSQQGVNHYNFGKHHSSETKLKMSTAQKGKPKSEETKRKISESMRQRYAGGINSRKSQ